MQALLTKSQRIVVIFGAYALLVLALLAVFDFLSVEYYFVLCLIGFLIIAQLSGPFVPRPRWRTRVNIVLLIGVLIFMLLVVSKVFEILKIKPF